MESNHKHLLRVVFVLSLSLNAVLLCGGTAITLRKGGLPWLEARLSLLFTRNTVDPSNPMATRCDILAQLPVNPEDTIILGDSIVNLAEWGELLHHAKNRGIAGDDTTAVLRRLPPIVAGHPRRIVLLVGMNNFRKGIPLSETKTEYTEIVKTIRSQSPNTELWILPTFPINTRLFRQWVAPYASDASMPDRKAIGESNAFLIRLAQSTEHVHFVPMPEVLDENGEINRKYTLDGLHLNGQGIKLIADKLRAMGLDD